MNSLVRIAACVLWSFASVAAVAQGTSKKPAILASGGAADGAWKWELQFWPGFDKCAGSGSRDCGTEVFHIQNDSPDVIECTGFIEYQGLNAQRQEFQTRIRAKDNWSDPVILSAYGLKVKAQAVNCAKYDPPPVLLPPEGCKPESSGAKLEDFYPRESQNYEETGTVRVRLTLQKPKGRASDVHVVDRSPYKRLDDSAVKFVRALTFATGCSPMIFDMGIKFTIVE